MGQGYSLTTLSAGSAGVDVPELSDLAYERNLGDARFMKAVRARHHNGMVVAKIVMKPYATMKFGKYIDHILCQLKRTCTSVNELSSDTRIQGKQSACLTFQMQLATTVLSKRAAMAISFASTSTALSTTV